MMKRLLSHQGAIARGQKNDNHHMGHNTEMVTESARNSTGNRFGAVQGDTTSDRSQLLSQAQIYNRI